METLDLLHELAIILSRNLILDHIAPPRFVGERLDRAMRLADWYDTVPHAGDDWATRESYSHFIDETLRQFRALSLYIDFLWHDGTHEYPSSAAMIADVVENRRLYVRLTCSAFGESPDDVPSDHLLLLPVFGEDSIGEHVDGHSVTLCYNDLFRAVHDVFGHALRGATFSATGEDVAWASHSAMYSARALPAMTTETRAQNSWVNFGPHLRNSEGVVPIKGEEGYVPPANRPFSAQKMALAPSWAYNIY